MATTFHLQIVTPDKPVFDGMAEKIIVRTITGDACILARHIDYAAALGIGEARVTDEEGNTRIAACNGGLLSVSDNQVRVMATTFEWAEDIDVKRAENAMAESREAIAKKDISQMELKMAEARLKRALVRLSVASDKFIFHYFLQKLTANILYVKIDYTTERGVIVWLMKKICLKSVFQNSRKEHIPKTSILSPNSFPLRNRIFCVFR